MLTKLEISGFKTFTDFSIEFSPFTIIAGPNGSGKSNLFDALQLLGRIADTDLQDAFQQQRGESQELFTLRADGSYADEMKFAVELLINKKISDKFGGEDNLNHTRLRYEIHIKRAKGYRNLDKLFVTYERLAPITKSDDKWFNKYVPQQYSQHWRPKAPGGARPFIDTKEIAGNLEIFMRQDGGARRGRPSPAFGTEQTVLSSVSKIDFLHVFAVKQEMMSWRFLQLNPVELRKPSSIQAKDIISVDGSNLPAALARMQAEDELIIKDLSREVHKLLPGIRRLELYFDEPHQQNVLYAHMTDGRRFSSRVLSEGTLRIIALCAFKYDTQYNDVLCFEEPENGVHPYRLSYMIRLLSDLSTNFYSQNSASDEKASLRQLIINTHSPGLLASLLALNKNNKQKNTAQYSAFFSLLTPETNPEKPSSQCTRMYQILMNDQYKIGFPQENHTSTYLLTEATRYLESQDIKDAIEVLKPHRK